jgi:hypothetical protein
MGCVIRVEKDWQRSYGRLGNLPHGLLVHDAILVELLADGRAVHA